jgi:hypothetical protein
MTANSASAPPKLPVWRTVRASYAIVGGNLRQLVRVCWVWVLIMVPVYIGLGWLAETWPGESGALATHRWLREITAALPSPADLPFLASMAVAWHRLVLREERVTQAACVRLDGVVWRYVFYAFAFVLLERGTLLICVILALNLAIEADPSTRILIDEVLAAPAFTGATMAIGLLVLPRLSLVMPALALGERLSLRGAWRITRGNTLRLGMATALCMLPAVTLAILVPLLIQLVRALWWLDFSWPQIVAFMWAWVPIWEFAIQLSQSLIYAVFVALAYPVLSIFGVTLLSLTYRFFAVPSDGRPPVSA